MVPLTPIDYLLYLLLSIGSDDPLTGRREHQIAFGPVPSRRLGQNLGIDNVTAKACSDTCLYCQVGPTTEKRVEPRPFFSPAEMHDVVAAHVRKVRSLGLSIDCLTLVPDGEPTLDSALGQNIERLRDIGIPIAVITNGSLLWREDVRARLRQVALTAYGLCWKSGPERYRGHPLSCG